MRVIHILISDRDPRLFTDLTLSLQAGYSYGLCGQVLPSATDVLPMVRGKFHAA